jgi:Flp pilus assembly protein TadB
METVDILVALSVIFGMVLFARLLVSSADQSARHKKFMEDLEKWDTKEKKHGAR